ncbi:hypothetical protein Q9R30_02775 [Arthrobacter sp. AB6]|uniref:hypothetical protein n=1 Tax=Arthrobacter sp. AB6 TaxID=2962570 RepID=UPI0028817255|nr:hypothetical protein [Arthrobacter sp. AB6]MDT0194273.1 hypothetical protein [Arthrobacter sp. AB6]
MGNNNAPEDRKIPPPARVLAAVVPIAGLAAVMAGGLVAWSNANASFGWFAYAPLGNQLFTGSGIAFVTQGTQLGLAMAVVGLLVLAFWAGYRIGKKAAR